MHCVFWLGTTSNFGYAQCVRQRRTGAQQGAGGDLGGVLAQARLLMARLLSRSDKVDKAIEELDGFYNSNPSNIGATVSLARLKEQRGNSERAVEALLDELERSLGPAPDQQAAVSYYREACAPQQEQIRNRLKEQGGQGEAFARREGVPQFRAEWARRAYSAR